MPAPPPRDRTKDQTPPIQRHNFDAKVCFDCRAADVALLDAEAERRQISRADVVREAVRRHLAAAARGE